MRVLPSAPATTGPTAAYDQANRLTSATVNGATSSYTYDGDGQRVSSTVGGTTTRAVYDVNAGLPVLLDDGSRKYVFGLGLAYAVDTAGTVEVYHTDGLGSVRAITNSAGTVTQTYQTDEFGIPTASQGSSTQPFGYTGEPRDGETGFVYLRARLYDPAVGRFLQRDPFPGLIGSPLSLNRYTYVENNPINAVDPSGLASSDITKKLPSFSNNCLIEQDGSGYLITVVGCTDMQVLVETAWFRLVRVGGMIFVQPLIRPAASDPNGGNSNGGDALQGEASEFRQFLRRLDRRMFHRFLNSVQSAAAEAGHALRSDEDTREILDEALARGYRIDRAGETAWVGGRHAHLISPQGQIVHFPLPEGFSP